MNVCGDINAVFEVSCTLYEGHPGMHYCEGVYWVNEVEDEETETVRGAVVRRGSL